MASTSWITQLPLDFPAFDQDFFCLDLSIIEHVSDYDSIAALSINP